MALVSNPILGDWVWQTSFEKVTFSTHPGPSLNKQSFLGQIRLSRHQLNSQRDKKSNRT